MKLPSGKWDNPKKLRNESTDLICYCYAGCVFFKVDKIDWDDPPAWADEWDNNPLVSKAGTKNPVIQQSSEISLEALQKLAGQLG